MKQLSLAEEEVAQRTHSGCLGSESRRLVEVLAADDGHDGALATSAKSDWRLQTSC